MTKKKYPYPDGTHVGGMLAFHDQEVMKKAIRRAAFFMERHPDYEPQFVRVANVICCNDKPDSDFVRHCTKFIEKDKDGNNGMQFDINVFAYSVLYIKAHGWDEYIHRLGQRECEDKKDGTGKWPAPVMSML